MRFFVAIFTLCSLLLFLGCPSPQGQESQNGGNIANADIEFVRAVENTDGSWTFHVTVTHPDTGWDDYTNGWDIVLADGGVIKPEGSSQFTRTLLHPHVDEQPFTRSQSGIRIPLGVTKVRIRAHDIVDGFGGKEIEVDLQAANNNEYEVERR
jgi:hypothetical protein